MKLEVPSVFLLKAGRIDFINSKPDSRVSLEFTAMWPNFHAWQYINDKNRDQ